MERLCERYCMSYLKAIKYYAYYDWKESAHKVRIRMRFADRLKFLFFGENCTFFFADEQVIQRTNADLEAFRKWRKEQEKQ